MACDEAIKKVQERENQGGQVTGLAEEQDVDWETIWNGALKGNKLLLALR